MISETGIWSEEEKIYHANSEDLLKSIKDLFDPTKPVIDFGCGTGFYLRELSKIGFNNLIGFEGTSVPDQPGVTFKIADLSKPILDNTTYGQVISFEVGEHIPEKYEQIFIDNITRYCNSRLIISWALVGQIGLGHVNCKPMDYIINEISKRGFIYNDELSLNIRNLPHLTTPWFNNTIMVFDSQLPQ